MKFKLGDFVRFVDEKREGYVTRLIDEQTLGVTDTDGFEIPVVTSNLTHVHGHQIAGATTEEQPMVAGEDFKESGLFLAVAEDPKASVVAHFTLLNRSSYQLLVTLKTDKKGVYKGEFAGVIQPKTAMQVFTANLGDLDNWPEFEFQALYFSTQNNKPKQPLLVSKKFKSKDFSGSKQMILEINKYGWLIALDEPLPTIDPQKLKESFFS
jgi:hypothetical protein